ncbi:MAG TPA: metal-dependent hydrolase [Limnobacter sp.]|nr:metal-dependent hydrolase [Limnobacter sp.]
MDKQNTGKKPVSIHQKGSSFPVRRMDFNFEGINRHFVNNDPACSHVWTAFQAYFPEGEQFFVDAVRDAKPMVRDEALLREISAFIGQEAMHGKEHKDANAELKRQGINVYGWDARARWARKKLNSLLPVKARLAGTTAVEHYTAVMAEHLMKSDHFHTLLSDPTVKNLIFWHAMEESEHRAVAFDTHKAVGGTYAQRAIAMTIVSIGIGPVVLAAMVSCMKQDGELYNLKSWAKFMNMYFGKPGVFRKMIPDLLQFYRPGFHPMETDMNSTMRLWKERLALV